MRRRWGWNHFSALKIGWFEGSVDIVRLVEETGTWLADVWGAHIVMMREEGGCATPTGH